MKIAAERVYEKIWHDQAESQNTDVGNVDKTKVEEISFIQYCQEDPVDKDPGRLFNLYVLGQADLSIEIGSFSPRNGLRHGKKTEFRSRRPILAKDNHIQRVTTAAQGEKMN